MPGFFEFQEKLRKPTSREAGPLMSGNGNGIGAPPPGPLTVSQLTKRLDRVIQSNLPDEILVRGEVSNYKHHGASGHKYFTLREGDACLDCVMFKDNGRALKFTPGDGMEIVATGRVKVYGAKGKYQLYATALDPVGQGALELAFRQLYAKLEAEGLFRPERKRPIPAYPTNIALLTSRQTAAVQDMLKVLRRFSFLRVCVYHVPVQGDGSAEKIAAAVEHLGRCCREIGGIDVILLARGGGSLEDLWEFNEEILARAIAASPIPVVTGIGHEVDTSIADLVADYHAHTPTEAAQVITGQWRNARETVETTSLRLRRAVEMGLNNARGRLTQVERHEVFRRPMDRVNQRRQFLDDRQKGLSLALANRLRDLSRQVRQADNRLQQHDPARLILRLRDRLSQRQQQLAATLGRRLRTAGDHVTRLASMLVECHPRHDLKLNRQRVDQLSDRLRLAAATDFRRRRQGIDALATHLTAVGPQQVLSRGYTITRNKRTGAVVRSVADVRPGTRLLTHLPDGQVESIADDAAQPRLFD